ncbi:MAG: hypothetical protein ABIZ49_07410, partial [Opitutaceae bacterium]
WDSDPTGPQTAQIAASVGAFAFNPNSKDAALVINLAPGAYAVHVRGAGSSSGIALVEIYEVP